MAAATVTATEWGYEVTGGTDATVINAKKMWVNTIAFSGNATTSTATLTSSTTAGQISCMKFTATQAANNMGNSQLSLGKPGCPFTNLTVTLSATSDILYVYLSF